LIPLIPPPVRDLLVFETKKNPSHRNRVNKGSIVDRDGTGLLGIGEGRVRPHGRSLPEGGEKVGEIDSSNQEPDGRHDDVGQEIHLTEFFTLVRVIE